MDVTNSNFSSTICLNFYMSKLASITPPVVFSMIGWVPMVMISVICRSEQNLRYSIYHRIMFGMGIMDMLSTIPLLFSTLPMPVDQIYPFQGITPQGTETTCKLQAFTQLVGILGSNIYFAGLSLFYLCTIAFHMKRESYRIRLEPIVHFVAIIVPVVACVSTSIAI